MQTAHLLSFRGCAGVLVNPVFWGRRIMSSIKFLPKGNWGYSRLSLVLLQDKAFLDWTLVLSFVEALQNITKGKGKSNL